MQLFSGREYLKIDIASNFGLDKKTWAERIAWFDEHEAHLDHLVKDAETPALFYAGVQAWKATLEGKATGYPVSLDATSSGLQLLACLTSDRQASQLCNVVQNQEGKRFDAYTHIYKLMMERLGESSKIERDDVKKAIMTALYGSKAQPKRVFGEGNQLKVFYEIMEQVAPAAWDLNELFLDIWDPEALSNDWVLPDNFHVHVKVMETTVDTVQLFNEPIEITRKVNMPKEKGRSLGANCIHSLDGMIVREISRRCDYDPARVAFIRENIEHGQGCVFADPKVKRTAHKMTGILWDHYQKSGYLSARILDYIDADSVEMVDKSVLKELIDSLPVKPFKVIATHDCFRSLPNYMNDVRRQYNLQLHLVAKSNLLSFLLSQIVKRDVQIGKLDETLAQDVLESEYALS